MKSYLLKPVLAILFLIAATTAYAQPYTITGHTEKDSCNGNFVFRTTSSLSGPLNIITYFGDGTSTINGPGFMTAIGAVHTYGLPGTYTVKHVLTHNNIPVDSVQFSITTTLCTHAVIRVYRDDNSNCVLDAQEKCWWSTASPVYVEIDSAGVKIDTVVASYYTMVALKPGMTYTFKMLNTPTSTIATCPVNATQTVTLPTTYNINYVDFAVECATSSFDLFIDKIYGRYRPVSTSYVVVTASAITCASENAVVTATISNKFNVLAASPTPASITGNVVTWNVPNLSNTNMFYGYVHLAPATPLSFALGDTICATATISPTAGDINVANNIKTSCDAVVASFDPNSKEVSPGGIIQAGTKLDYTIHYENLGTDTAFNIYILDTLSDHVDANSFRFTGASHRTAPSIFTGANGKKIVRFEMADIKLPEAAVPEGNKGYVTYSINVKNNTPLGTEIKNRAGIYFDVNPVVMTNTTQNWIDYLNVKETTSNKAVKVYPNPNTGVFTIETGMGKYDHVKMTNAMGQVVTEQSITSAKAVINASSQPAGIYYIVLTGIAGNAVVKVIKE